MKRTTTLFTATVFLLTLGATQIWAQQPTSPKFTPAPYDSKVIDGSEQTSPNQTNQSEVYRSSRSSHSIGTDIGETTYDLQSNSAVARRVGIPFEGADSLIVITWTGDLNYSLAAPGRGTFYNKWDTSGWGPIPSQRLENLRTGWPDNVITETGKEFIISHDPSAYDMVTLTRPVAGEGSWTQNKPGFDGIWPRAATGGGDTIHVINARNFGGDPENENNFTQYHRSPDGGITWDIMNQVLPGIDQNGGYSRMSGDSYSIDAQGDIVTIVAGDGTYNPVALWKSTDAGNTWTRTVVLEHPVPNADIGTTSGPDCGDPANFWYLHDGTAQVVIDNDGKAHIFTGYMAWCNDGGTAFSFFPLFDGIIYWNESMSTLVMPDDTNNIITGTPNSDQVGDIDSIANYFTSLSTMAMPVIDPISGNIYLFYSSPTIPDGVGPGAQYLRDIYGVFSEDGGNTWSEPVNLTNTAADGRENVFLGSYREVVDGVMHAAWQTDDLPGLAVRGEEHAFVDNDIHYYPFTHCDFTEDTTNVYLFLAGGDTITLEGCGGAASEPWIEPGYSAISCSDSPLDSVQITGTVDTSTVGTYNLMYDVADTTGQRDTAYRVVQVTKQDFTPPQITMMDEDTICVALNDPYTDAGATALDNCDGDITDSIEVTNNVDVNTVGSYEVTYDVTDDAGNNGDRVTRTVLVLDLEAGFNTSASGLAVQFFDTSQDMPDSWSWDFGDGGVSTSDPNPLYAYSKDSTYTVCLTVTNCTGEEDTECEDITVVGINELEIDEISVYPNPASGSFNIDLGMLHTQTNQISIYNTVGEKVRRISKSEISGKERLQVDLSGQATGIYFIRIQAEEGVATKKVTLTR